MYRLSILQACTRSSAATWATSHKCSLREPEEGRGIRMHRQRGDQLTSPHLQWEHSQHFPMEGLTVRGQPTVFPRG